MQQFNELVFKFLPLSLEKDAFPESVLCQAIYFRATLKEEQTFNLIFTGDSINLQISALHFRICVVLTGTKTRVSHYEKVCSL